MPCASGFAKRSTSSINAFGTLAGSAEVGPRICWHALPLQCVIRWKGPGDGDGAQASGRVQVKLMRMWQMIVLVSTQPLLTITTGPTSRQGGCLSVLRPGSWGIERIAHEQIGHIWTVSLMLSSHSRPEPERKRFFRQNTNLCYASGYTDVTRVRNCAKFER